jgi:filamentous hemagglutinin
MENILTKDSESVIMLIPDEGNVNSGNFGHSGRPGQVGGSASSGENDMPHKEALKNFDKANIPIEKIADYSLKDPNKARVFKSVLGYTVDDADEVLEKIRDNVGKYPAVDKGNTEYGTLAQVDIEMTGKNGNTAVVRTAWIFDTGSDVPRLTSAYINTRKR